MAQEFLPLCDVLFNIISLASYFCDIVFDVVTVYTLYLHEDYIWFSLALGSIMTSLLMSQLLSMQWYNSHRRDHDASFAFVVLTHLFQFGVLWRYFKLFMPVDLAHVKNDVRDLCMLRLIHGFCEAAPMLLIQLYLIWLKPSSSNVSDLNVVSTIFSLFSICWALASFNKNVRRKNIHRLVLTWLGVIFQFLWRLGTVSSRAVALTVYATLYHYWVFVVIGLHWLSMFLWIISPKNVFHGEPIVRTKKIGYSMVIAYVYIFCYINLQEINPRQKIITFYVTMFLENTLIVAIWLGVQDKIKWYHYPVACIVWGGFAIGLLFMVLYYRYFHIRRLKHLLTESIRPNSDCVGCAEHSVTSTYLISENSNGDLPKSPFGNKSINTSAGSYQNGMVNSVPGVFNCRLNPAFKRKKKKPSSFVPPPSSIQVPSLGNGKMINPFWKKPPIKYYSSDHESVSSRVNIQQKLQEKKQQQLQELKEIEEEIKQGKLKRPHPLEISEQGTLRQPIPTSKKQPTLRPDLPAVIESQFLYQNILGLPMRLKGKQRSQTPEILLSPHYLDNSRIYYDYQDPHAIYSMIPNTSLRRRGSDVSSNSNVSSFGQRKLLRPRNKFSGDPNAQNHKVMYKSYCVPSDLDSQISLPRSYTLPREFRYYRRPKARKMILRAEHFAASNNSSDGDVDSLDENEPDVLPANRPPRSRMYPLPLRSISRQLHETKL